jgi:hypothetical protein
LCAARNERRLLFLSDQTFEKVREGEAEEEELPAEPEPENPMMYENFLLALQRAGEGDGADTALARALAAQGTYTTPLRIEPADGAPLALEGSAFGSWSGEGALPLVVVVVVVVENPRAATGRPGKLRPFRLRDGEKTPGVRWPHLLVALTGDRADEEGVLLMSLIKFISCRIAGRVA